MFRGLLGRAKGLPEVIFAVFLNADKNRWPKTCKTQGQCCIFAVGEVEAFFPEVVVRRRTWVREVKRSCSARCKMFARPLQDLRTFAARCSHARCKPCWSGSLFPLAHLIVPDGPATLYRTPDQPHFSHKQEYGVAGDIYHAVRGSGQVQRRHARAGRHPLPRDEAECAGLIAPRITPQAQKRTGHRFPPMP